MPALAAAPPPLAAHQVLLLLLQLGVLLTVATCLGRYLLRWGLPAVVGELLAGVLLGPSVLGHLAPGLARWLFPANPEQAHLLDAVTQLSVLLLVGVTGAQFEARLLRRRAGTVARLSTAALVLPLALGVAVGYLLARVMMPDADRPVFAAFFGVVMGVSALPVIAKTLTDLNLMHRDIGQLIIAAGAVDDAVAWFLLSVVTAMATVGLHTLPVLRSVGYLLGLLVVAVLAGRPLVRWGFRLAGRSSDATPTVVLAVAMILFASAATNAIGMEAVLGAFLAAVLIGLPGSADPRRLAALRATVLTVLAPIFLASAGLRMDLTTLRGPWLLLAALAIIVAATVGKFAGAYLGARTSRLGRWEAVALGAGLNARGAVEVVVATVGLRLGVLNVAAYTIVVLVAIVTSLMAAPVLRHAATRIEQNAEEQLRAAEQELWTVPQR
jgi:Kef-type K+ transport system membrane component KefB